MKTPAIIFIQGLQYDYNEYAKIDNYNRYSIEKRELYEPPFVNSKNLLTFDGKR